MRKSLPLTEYSQMQRLVALAPPQKPVAVGATAAGGGGGGGGSGSAVSVATTLREARTSRRTNKTLKSWRMMFVMGRDEEAMSKSQEARGIGRPVCPAVFTEAPLRRLERYKWGIYDVTLLLNWRNDPRSEQQSKAGLPQCHPPPTLQSVHSAGWRWHIYGSLQAAKALKNFQVSPAVVWDCVVLRGPKGDRGARVDGGGRQSIVKTLSNGDATEQSPNVITLLRVYI